MTSAKSKSKPHLEPRQTGTKPVSPRLEAQAKSETKSEAKGEAKPQAKSGGKPHTKPRKLEPPVLSHPEIRAIVLGIMLAMFLGALDQTIVATALPTIGRHFGNINDLSWVVTAYLLTGTAVTPLYGKLADIYGRRLLMLSAVGIFVAGAGGLPPGPPPARRGAARA